MPYLTITIRVTSDIGSEPVTALDYIARINVTESQQLNLQKAGGDTVGVFTTIPTVDKIPALNAIVLTNDVAVNYKFASVGAADGIIAMQDGGLVVIVRGNIAAGAALNALCNNTGANAVTISGLAGGT